MGSQQKEGRKAQTKLDRGNGKRKSGTTSKKTTQGIDSLLLMGRKKT